MLKFRKKQVDVEAFRWGVDDPPAWFQDAISKGKVELDGSWAVIETLEGKMRAEKGDWVIRGVQGELYPCKPDIFQQSYEAAE
jgi:hypothetical protein